MVRAKTVEVFLQNHGEYLGYSEENGFFITDKNKKDKTKYGHRIKEIHIGFGNLVSIMALTQMVENNITAVLTDMVDRPIAVLKPIEDDSHVKTRICQYEALKNEKGIHIAKQILIGKIEGQNQVLKKYGLRTDTSIRLLINALNISDLNLLRRKLLYIEGKFAEFYFKQIFQLIPAKLRPEQRIGFNAYDGMNNLFNYAYQILFSKCYTALLKSKLEPYLGFLHGIKFGLPSLVCDFQELYRYLIDDFIIQYSQNLRKMDFRRNKTKTVYFHPRIYLTEEQHAKYKNSLHNYFRQIIDVPRIMRGKKQELETLMNEEALLLAKFLRNEEKAWTPRIVQIADRG